MYLRNNKNNKHKIQVYAMEAKHNRITIVYIVFVHFKFSKNWSKLSQNKPNTPLLFPKPQDAHWLFSRTSALYLLYPNMNDFICSLGYITMLYTNLISGKDSLNKEGCHKDVMPSLTFSTYYFS